MTRLTQEELAAALATHEVIADTGNVDMSKTPTHSEFDRRQKYNAQPTEADGIKFASKVEAKRYQELLTMQRAGAISDLQTHPSFLLQQAFKDAWGTHHRKVSYTADFQYVRDGTVIVEDVKGGKATQNAAFSIRWKWAIKLNPTIKFEIVTMQRS